MGTLEVPKALADRVRMLWGEDGGHWLAILPDLAARCMAAWELDTPVVCDALSVSLVVFVRSHRHGEAVLKIGFPHREMETGLAALARFPATWSCRVFEADPTHCAVLLERIRPGDSLDREPDFAKRLRAVSGLLRHLPVPLAAEDETIFPAYECQLQNQLLRAREHLSAPGLRDRSASARLATGLAQAERLHGEIHNGSRPRSLLHGDLRHENILRAGRAGQAGDQAWKAIDPQGWAGEAVLDVGRFFQHEWGRHAAGDVRDAMTQLVSGLAGALDEAPRIVAAACFLNSIRTACWAMDTPTRALHLEDNLDRMDWLCRTYRL